MKIKYLSVGIFSMETLTSLKPCSKEIGNFTRFSAN